MVSTQYLPSLFLLLLIFSGCSYDRRDLVRYDLMVPGTEKEVLDVGKVFTAGEHKLNTYQRYFNGNDDKLTSRVLTRSPQLDNRWIALDQEGGFISFLLDEDFLQIPAAKNGRRESFIRFEPYLSYSPTRMTLGDTHESAVDFEVWNQEESGRRTGNLSIKTVYTGTNPIELSELGTLNCPRIDSTILLNLSYGLSVSVEQSQWFHGLYGEVLQDVQGNVELLSVPLYKFTARQQLISSERIDSEEVLRILLENRFSETLND